jgi:GNAT superfamily N-acetyltransferase
MTLLFDQYMFQFCSPKERQEVFETYRPIVFQSTYDFNTEDCYTTEESEKAKALYQHIKSAYRYDLLIYHAGEVIGWSFGMQYSTEDFYMVNTGILPDYQGRGVYTCLLPHIISHLKEAGFQRIFSRHLLSNNAVIVPKLKAGFIITGMEIVAKFGALLHLSYFTNADRLNLVQVRIGKEHPSPANIARIGI